VRRTLKERPVQGEADRKCPCKRYKTYEEIRDRKAHSSRQKPERRLLPPAAGDQFRIEKRNLEGDEKG